MFQTMEVSLMQQFDLVCKLRNADPEAIFRQAGTQYGKVQDSIFCDEIQGDLFHSENRQ